MIGCSASRMSVGHPSGACQRRLSSGGGSAAAATCHAAHSQPERVAIVAEHLVGPLAQFLHMAAKNRAVWASPGRCPASVLATSTECSLGVAGRPELRAAAQLGCCRRMRQSGTEAPLLGGRGPFFLFLLFSRVRMLPCMRLIEEVHTRGASRSTLHQLRIRPCMLAAQLAGSLVLV